MPRYELMYLLGSQVADNEVPTITEQIKKFVSDFGGSDIEETQLGKKKLAYPIGKTRNGFYVVVDFTMDGRKVNDLDAKLRTQNSIIRSLLVNMDEHIERSKKDEAIRAKLAAKRPAEMQNASPAAAVTEKTPAAPAVEIDEKALDEKIEAALSEDITK